MTYNTLVLGSIGRFFNNPIYFGLIIAICIFGLMISIFLFGYFLGRKDYKLKIMNIIERDITNALNNKLYPAGKGWNNISGHTLTSFKEQIRSIK